MRISILIFFSCLLFWACKKKETSSDDSYKSYNAKLYIKKNGKNWNPKSRAVFTKSRFYFSVVEVKDGFEYDIFEIGNILPQKGTYNLVDKRVWDTTQEENLKNLPTAWYNGSFQQGSDVVSRNLLRKDRPYSITIDSYDSINHIAKGSFSLSFIRDSLYSKMGIYIDTVSYTDAIFSAKVWHQDELPK